MTTKDIKKQLAAELVRAIDGWSQWNAAVLLGIDQPAISRLKRGHLDRFSIDKLITLLSLAERDVTIVITPRKTRRAYLFTSSG